MHSPRPCLEDLVDRRLPSALVRDEAALVALPGVPCISAALIFGHADFR